MSENKKLRKGQAYREYLAVRAFVEQKWEEGYDLKEIHEMLIAEKRITMSYSALHSNRKRVLARELEKAQALGLVSAWPSQGTPRQPSKKQPGQSPRLHRQFHHALFPPRPTYCRQPTVSQWSGLWKENWRPSIWNHRPSSKNLTVRKCFKLKG